MARRTHSERLKHDLADIRTELTDAVAGIPAEGIDWAPAGGMKSYRALLQEIGAMEAVCAEYATTGSTADWETLFESIGKSGSDGASMLRDLDAVRRKTLTYLDACSEEDLERPIPLVEAWQGYFGGAKEIEPEELIRWICRHEYYHLGQIIICRWQQGHNPYSPGS